MYFWGTFIIITKDYFNVPNERALKPIIKYKVDIREF